MGFDIGCVFLFVCLFCRAFVCKGIQIGSVLSDAQCGAEGGGNAPLSWMPTTEEEAKRKRCVYCPERSGV